MEHIHYLYKRCGFNITTLHTDGEFKFIANDLRKLYIDVNVTAACEHVTEIVHQIRVIKEQARAAWNTLPFKFKPKILVRELIYYIVLWLNSFPPKGAISPVYSK